MSTEIFKMPKADVGEADDDRDDQNDECEHGRCSRKPFGKKVEGKTLSDCTETFKGCVCSSTWALFS